MFQQDFDALKGWMYHLGNPGCDAADYRGSYYAYELLSTRSQERKDCSLLEFAPDVLPGVRLLLEIALSLSPVQRLVFTSDWQVGPKPPLRAPATPLDEFWRRHDRLELRMNALYPILG